MRAAGSTWGDGTTSSSDRQFFRSAKRGDAAGEVNARYGHDPGLGFYTHVSDQHGPYNVRVMSATSHEAPYVLEGLMHHGTALRIGTHYTDTGGASDHVFILCAMLGFRFCPRLRDLPERKLATIEPATAYKDLAPLIGRRIKADVIREHWDEILRLVASATRRWAKIRQHRWAEIHCHSQAPDHGSVFRILTPAPPPFSAMN